MKIGVISDTHDRLTTLRRAVAFFKRMQVQAVFHAGDYVAPFAAKLLTPEELGVPFHGIYGNNDGERKGLKAILPSLQDGPLTIRLGGKTIIMHHFVDWLTPTDIAPADIVITGHTHLAGNQTRSGKLFLNPGECCGWVNDRATIALLDLNSVKAEIIEVHE